MMSQSVQAAAQQMLKQTQPVLTELPSWKAFSRPGQAQGDAGLFRSIWEQAVPEMTSASAASVGMSEEQEREEAGG